MTKITEDYRNRTTNYTSNSKVFKTTNNKLTIPSLHQTFNIQGESPKKINYNRTTTNLLHNRRSEQDRTDDDKKKEIINLKYQLETLKNKKVIVRDANVDEVQEEFDTIVVNLNNNSVKNEKEVKENGGISQKVQKVLLNSTRILSDNLEGFKRTIQEKEERLEGNKKKLQEKSEKKKLLKEIISEKRVIRSKVTKLINNSNYFICQDFLFKIVKNH